MKGCRSAADRNRWRQRNGIEGLPEVNKGSRQGSKMLFEVVESSVEIIEGVTNAVTDASTET